MVTNDSQIWKKGGSFDIQDCGYKGWPATWNGGGTNCWVSGQGITPLECAPQTNPPAFQLPSDRFMIAIQNMYTDWLLFEWLNLIMPQMLQLACVCPWSLALLRSGYHYPHFQRAWFWSDPIGPVIVCDLRPSVITYDMVCPHLTPYKAIHSIDSQLLHHHTIKELQKILLRPCAQGIRLFWIFIVPYNKSLFSF